MRRSCSILALVLALSALPAAEQAKLKAKPLPAPPLTMTHADLKADMLLDGQVRSPVFLEFKNSDVSAKDVNFGPVAFKLGLRGSGVQIEFDGKAQQLKAKGDDLSPTMLPLLDKHRFFLSFPILDRGRTTTGIYMRNGMVFGGKLDRDTVLFYDSNQDTEIDLQDGYCSIKTPTLFAPIKDLIIGPKGIYKIEGFEKDEKYVYANYSPYEGETAELTVIPATGGGGQLLAVFTKSDDSLAFVSEGKKDEYPVTPGEYQLSYGQVLGKNGNDQVVVARVETGEYQPVTVAAEGAEATIGGPYTLRFQVSKTTEKGKPVLSISPYNLRLFGANGEEYKEFEYKNLPVVTLEGGRKPVTLGSFEYG